MTIRNLRIGARLSLGFGLVLALMALMILIGVVRLQDIGNATQRNVRHAVARAKVAVKPAAASLSRPARQDSEWETF